jgi:hypothetical protein
MNGTTTGPPPGVPPSAMRTTTWSPLRVEAAGAPDRNLWSAGGSKASVRPPSGGRLCG